MISFVFCFLFPYFVNRVAYEAENRLFHMIQLSGMRTPVYWAANFAFDYVLNFCWCLLLIAIAYFVAVPIVQQANAALYVALIVCWSHVLIGMAWIMAACLSSQ